VPCLASINSQTVTDNTAGPVIGYPWEPPSAGGNPGGLP